MLQEKVRAAMRWLTERSKGSVLLPSDIVSVKVNGKESTLSVLDALRLKLLEVNTFIDCCS